MTFIEISYFKQQTSLLLLGNGAKMIGASLLGCIGVSAMEISAKKMVHFWEKELYFSGALITTQIIQRALFLHFQYF